MTGLTNSNQLFTFNSATPGTTTTFPPITGLMPGENLIAIDRHPTNGKLYGLSVNRVYEINEAANAATAGPALAEALTSTNAGFDFHPQGYARIVTDTDQNLFWQPSGNGFIETDLAFDTGDTNFGENPNVRAIAYTPNVPFAFFSTVYGYDFNVESLVRLGAVNGDGEYPGLGKLHTVGPSNQFTGASIGLDAAYDGTMFASLRIGGVTGLYTVNTGTGAVTSLGSIGPGNDTTLDITADPVTNNFKFSALTYDVGESDGSVTVTVERSQSLGFASVSLTLADGSATGVRDYRPLGASLTFNAGEAAKTFTIPIRGDVEDETDETFTASLSNPSGGRAATVAPSTAIIEIADDDTGPPPSTLLTALTTTNGLVTFDSRTPGTLPAPLPVTGLVGTDSLYAIDRRPATGQLYAMSKESRLYTIDETTGVATQVGSAQFVPPLAGPAWGFDFDPVADSIRVSATNGQNLEIDPDTGIATAWSPFTYEPGGPLAGQTASLQGIAYTDNVPGAPSTTLFGYDFSKDDLARVGSPGGSPNSVNSGLTATIGDSGISAQISDAVGMDIGWDGTAWTLLRSSNLTQLNIMNLATGTPDLVGEMGSGAPDYRDIAAPAVSNVVQLSGDSFSAGEGAGTAAVTVTRSQTLGAATVQYATSDGSAAAGSDYTATSGTLTLAAGEASKDIAIPLTDDAAVEPAETLTLTLSSASGGVASLGAPTTATVTLSDNDVEAPPDTTKPVASTCHKKRQNMVKQKGVKACVRSSEAGTALITGKLKVRGVKRAFTLRRARGPVSPGSRLRRKLKLPRKALRALRRAKRGTATLTFKVSDAAGNETKLSRRVRHRGAT